GTGRTRAPPFPPGPHRFGEPPEHQHLARGRFVPASYTGEQTDCHADPSELSGGGLSSSWVGRARRERAARPAFEKRRPGIRRRGGELGLRPLGGDDAVLLDALVEGAAREAQHLDRKSVV